MNSTKKGDAFESRVYDILLEALSQDKLFIPGKRSLLFKKHSYYSRDREKNIIFDLVIETYREGADKPNTIVLIECKDYGKSVTVDDVEEFYAKKEQVARANSKLLLITTASLQESAFNYATNLGIGVVRILDDDSMMWLIERSNKNLTTNTKNTLAINVLNALTNEFYVSVHDRTFGFLNNTAYMEMSDLLFDMIDGDMNAVSGISG